MRLENVKRALARHLPVLSYMSYELYSRRPAMQAARAANEKVLADLQRTLGSGFDPARKGGQTVLFLSMGQISYALLETVIVAGFEEAECHSTLLAPRHLSLRRAFRLLGQRDFGSFTDFIRRPAAADEVAAIVDRYANALDLLDFKQEGVALGRYAVSTAMRTMRDGELRITDPQVRAALIAGLSESIVAHDAACLMLDRYHPAAVVMVDRGYTPNGEIAENCILRGIPVYTFNIAHRNSTVILKRYDAENTQEHFHSLSPETWRRLESGPWTPAMADALRDEVDGAYLKQEWYAEVGTQRNTRLVEPNSLRRQLELRPGRKVAAIFPHIFWDATFFWGEDLYPTYEQWFRAVIREAARNTQVDWVIKVHPANRVKSARDQHSGLHSEELALRDELGGDLPDHIKLLPADSEVSTLSFFDILDYCVTVRGTVGIECAARGVTVLTCGTGRYDQRGFTVDFSDRETYTKTLARIETLPAPSPEAIERARKFAYGTFVLRPTPLSSIVHAYRGDETASLHTELRVNSRPALGAAPDVQAIAQYVLSGQEDYANWPLYERHTAKMTSAQI